MDSVPRDIAYRLKKRLEERAGGVTFSDRVLRVRDNEIEVYGVTLNFKEVPRQIAGRDSGKSLEVYLFEDDMPAVRFRKSINAQATGKKVIGARIGAKERYSEVIFDVSVTNKMGIGVRFDLTYHANSSGMTQNLDKLFNAVYNCGLKGILSAVLDSRK